MDTSSKTSESKHVLFAITGQATEDQLQAAVNAALGAAIEATAPVPPDLKREVFVRVIYTKAGTKKGMSLFFCPDRRVANVLLGLDFEGRPRYAEKELEPCVLDFDSPMLSANWADDADDTGPELGKAYPPICVDYTPEQALAAGESCQKVDLMRCMVEGKSGVRMSGLSPDVLTCKVPDGLAVAHLQALLKRFSTSPKPFPVFSGAGDRLEASFDPETEDALSAQQMLLFYVTKARDVPGVAEGKVVMFSFKRATTERDEGGRRGHGPKPTGRAARPAATPAAAAASARGKPKPKIPAASPDQRVSVTIKFTVTRKKC